MSELRHSSDPQDDAGANSKPSSPFATLEAIIEHAAHMLPSQAPITTFVHHNTLHAFEELPFHDALKKAAKLFGHEVYLSEDRYRSELVRGRITPADLTAVLVDQLGPAANDNIGSLATRLDVRLAMLQHPIREAPDAELRWFVAETDALARYREDAPTGARDKFLRETRHWIMRDVPGRDGPASPQSDRRGGLAKLFRRLDRQALDGWHDKQWQALSLQVLWQVCRDGVQHAPARPLQEDFPCRHRDLPLQEVGVDTDRLVNDFLIRFCAAFLDQGVAPWPLPGRERGFYESFCMLYSQPHGPPDRWLRGLSETLARLQKDRIGPLASIHESLSQLGVPDAEWQTFLTATLLSLPGWPGMLQQVECRPESVAVPIPRDSVTGFLAVRLLLERLALSHVAREEFGYDGPLSGLLDAARERIALLRGDDAEQRAFVIFQLAQVLGWPAGTLHELGRAQWAQLVAEFESFDGMERRRVFHEAYERHYRTLALDALSIHAQRPAERVHDPRFQVVCCIDEREESFIRHLEELEPKAETFSVAGFFAVAMYYRGSADAHFVPHCPIVIKPQNWVVEDVAYTLEEAHRRRASVRRALGTVFHKLHLGSRTFVGGIAVATLGVLASIPLVARVLFPRLTSRIRKGFGNLVRPPIMTQLRLERADPVPGANDAHVGFSLDEMANNAERVLRDIGLTSSFARLLIFLGHGSASVNNPHNSAYNCGACSGTLGGPNARAIAQILNDPRVRDLLARRGLMIPRETIILGGFHNTADDSVSFYDLDRLPRTHHEEFDRVRTILDNTCDRNAHERCRRFESAPLDMTFPEARRHVEGRAEDLSQTRPECGHATNALCIVGRRSRTRGLFLDRRAFINSYDPTQDDDKASILLRTLQAAIPVCAGISLEYYFSYVDSPGWGCGTKLPHNVAALLGVMDGSLSDLRTGLPWQMVEIHEPLRILFIIETTPETMLSIMDRNEAIGKLCRNGWVQLATLDPHSASIQLFREGRFEVYEQENRELPEIASSFHWYRGWRDHLGFARLGERVSQPTTGVENVEYAVGSGTE